MKRVCGPEFVAPHPQRHMQSATLGRMPVIEVVAAIIPKKHTEQSEAEKIQPFLTRIAPCLNQQPSVSSWLRADSERGHAHGGLRPRPATSLFAQIRATLRHVVPRRRTGGRMARGGS